MKSLSYKSNKQLIFPSQNQIGCFEKSSYGWHYIFALIKEVWQL